MKQSVVIAINGFSHPSRERQQAIDVALGVLLHHQMSFPWLRVVSINHPNDAPCLPPEIEILPLLRRIPSIHPAPRSRTFLFDMIEIAASLGTEVFGYVNADIMLRSDAVESLSSLQRGGMLLARTDIQACSTQQLLDGDVSVIDPDHPGFDGVFFRREWWSRNNHIFPRDLLVGECGWDDVYSWIFHRALGAGSRDRLLYHVKHSQEWTHETAGGAHNLAIFEQVKEQCHRGEFMLRR